MRSILARALSVLVFCAWFLCIAWYIGRAESARGVELFPWLGYTHVSDIMRGPPLGAVLDGCEPTTDWLGVGVTVAFPRVDVDIAHGIKQRDAWCGRPYAQARESGTLASVRWYVWRKRN
jgi:hypothetical protein